MSRLHDAVALHLYSLIKMAEEGGSMPQGTSARFLAVFFEVPPQCYDVSVRERRGPATVKVDELKVNVEVDEKTPTHLVAIFDCDDGTRTYVLSLREAEEKEEVSEEEL